MSRRGLSVFRDPTPKLSGDPESDILDHESYKSQVLSVLVLHGKTVGREEGHNG